MNRAERRRLEKSREKRKATAPDLTRVEITNAIDYSSTAYSAALALVLHDKLGFGKKRSHRLMSQVWEVFESIKSGYLTLDDVLDTVKNELEIDLEAQKKR